MKLRHKTTVGVIGENQWNEDHVTPAYDHGNWNYTPRYLDVSQGTVQIASLLQSVELRLPIITYGIAEHITLVLTNLAGARTLTVVQVNSTPVESGTITSIDGIFVVDSSKAWTLNAYAQYTLQITSGAHSGKIFNIAANTATQLGIPESPTPLPESGLVGETFSIHDSIPTRWMGGVEPDFDSSDTATNLLIGRGIGGFGWVCDGAVV